jgi:glutamate carboxypeptidase
VEDETPTTDAAAVNRLMDRCDAELRAVGGAVERLPGATASADTLICRTPGEGAPVVVAGHLDTVWDHGTLAGPMPFRVEDGKAFGPGIYDMKAGSFMAFHSVRRSCARRPRRAGPSPCCSPPTRRWAARPAARRSRPPPAAPAPC